ncbi:MAG: MarR family transcriptional regulator [bacterium]|nr:MarR family transcriptional regulator [bacterium]
MPAEKPKENKKYPEGVEAALDRFIESAGKISANMLGMVNKVGGQIYALLFLSREPLSLDEISEILQVSKGNISVNVRLLEELKLVKKVWVKGSRRDFYEANRDYPRKLLKGFFDRIREGIDESMRLIHRCQGQLEEALPEAGEGTDAQKDADFMMLQLNILKSFYSAAARVFEDFYQGREVNTDLLRHAILD